MAAAVEPVAAGEAFRAAIPVQLFENPVLATFNPGSNGFTYDVFPDGSEFLFISPADADGNSGLQLKVTENWFDELNELAPIPD